MSSPTRGLLLLKNAIRIWCPQPFTVDFSRRLGLELPASSVLSLFRSIHRSNKSFLNRQRLPSLNAGMLFSLRYLYRVSGEIPRYWDASRNVITSFNRSIFCPVSSLSNMRYWGTLPGLFPVFWMRDYRHDLVKTRKICGEWTQDVHAV